MNLQRVRAVFGVNLQKVPAAAGRADAMRSGMADDPLTYDAPDPALPAFQKLITDVTSAQTEVRKRTVGAAATRDVALRLLIGGMESERLFVQGLADKDPSRAVQITSAAP